MKFPLLVFFLTAFLGTNVVAQNNQFLYGFQEIPQSLLENPGSEVTFVKHFGIPFLSGFYANGGTNNSLISSLFENDGVDLNTKLQGIILRLNTRDFISVNEQLDIINIGYKLKNDKDYLSAGFYQELNLTSYYPKDAAIVFYQGNFADNGNIELNRDYDINHVRFKSEVIGVFHVGISRRMNKNLTTGVRVKLYSGAFNIQSLHNKGTISTILDQNGEYRHLLNNVDVTYQSSGLGKISNNTLVGNTLKNIFFGGNLGLGFDVGFTYHLNENITLLGSVLDLGFITYSNNVTTYKIKGNIEVIDIGLINPPVDNTIDYWENISEDINRQIPKDSIHSTYVSFRSPRINGALQYGFGKKTGRHRSTDCPDLNVRTSINYQNEIGLQVYSTIRLNRPQFATTLYYSRKVSDFLRAKITYTADSFSFSNIGLGFSKQVGNFNLYAAADNLLSYGDFYNSKKLSFNFGMNLTFDKF